MNFKHEQSGRLLVHVQADNLSTSQNENGKSDTPYYLPEFIELEVMPPKLDE
jgi:hypothetical protein